jgi:CcmD family protein
MIVDPIRALWYLAGALAAIWLLLAGYVGLLAFRLRRAETELSRLERDVEADPGE